MEQEVILRKRIKALFDAGLRDSILARNLAQTIAVYHAEHLAVFLHSEQTGVWQRLALCKQTNLLAETFLNLAPLFYIDSEDTTAKKENVEYVLKRFWDNAETTGGTSTIIHRELETATAFVLFGALTQAGDRLTILEEGMYARFDLELRWKRAAAEIVELLTKEEAK